MVIRFRQRTIPLFFLLVYSVIICAFGYGRIQQITFILFCGSAILYVGLPGRIRIGRFGLSYFLFVLWAWLQIFLGLCIHRETSLSMAMTLLLNLVYIVVCFSVIRDTDNENVLLDFVVAAFSISLVIILVGSASSLFSKRLGLADENGISFNFGPITSMISPNEIGLWTSIGFLISNYLKDTVKQRKYILLMALFLFGNIMSASRKGLITLILGMLIYYVFSAKRSKKFMRILCAFVVVAIVIFALFSIEPLYNQYGHRIMQLINYYVLDTVDADVIGSSLRTRVGLLKRAEGYFLNNPIVGYGVNAYSYMNPLHIVADNNYWEILVAGGIIGFVLYYSFILRMLISLWRCKVKNKFYWLICAIVVIAIFSDFTGSNYYLRSALFPIVLADGLWEIHKRKILKFEVEEKLK